MKNQSQHADQKTTDQAGGRNGKAETLKFDGDPLPLPPATPACLMRRDVAGLLQVSVSTVDRMVADGHLQRVKVRRLVRFSPAEVEKYLNAKN